MGIHPSKIVWLFCLGVIASIIARGIWFAETQTSPYKIYDQQIVQFEAKVVREPVVTKSGQIVDLLPKGSQVFIRAQLFFPDYIHKGDWVLARGVIELPSNFSEFDYAAYLARYNIYAQLKKPKIIVYQKADCRWYCVLRQFRKNLISQTDSRFSGTSSALIMGMLLGERGSLPSKVEEDFRRTGLTHILAVSGFNMTILASSIGVLAWLIGRRFADWSGLLAIVIFTLLTGMTAAVIRAALMSASWLLARILGRVSYSYTALLLTVTIMLMINPKLALHDVGFQLSVAATVGVLSVYQISPEQKSLMSQIIKPTLGAMIMTVPIIAFHFQTISLISPLANLLILPLVPTLMLLGAISFLPALNIFVIPLLEMLLQVEVWVIAGLSKWPFASQSIDIHSSWFIIYYFTAFSIFWLIYRQNWGENQLKAEFNYGKLKAINL